MIISTDSLFSFTAFDTLVTPSFLIIPPGKLNSLTRYFWKVRGRNIGGYGPWSLTWNFTTGVIGIRMISTLVPDEFELHQNYPNPFNSETKIEFGLPVNSSTRIEIFDISGRLISSLNEQSLSAGIYSFRINFQDLSSGIYFYRLSAKNFSQTKRMIMVK
jgi:hypothetical protein